MAAAEIVVYASKAPLKVGAWQVDADSTAAGGAKMRHPNLGAAKITAPSANPANYFEVTFNAEAGRPYRLWLRGRADGNSWANDSVFVQFDQSVTSGDAPTWRIGTTSAADVNLEECSGCGVSAWGWQDNGYGTGVLGPLVYFAVSGPQTLRSRLARTAFRSIRSSCRRRHFCPRRRGRRRTTLASWPPPSDRYRS